MGQTETKRKTEKRIEKTEDKMEEEIVNDCWRKQEKREMKKR